MLNICQGARQGRSQWRDSAASPLQLLLQHLHTFALNALLHMHWSSSAHCSPDIVNPSALK